MLTAFLLLGLAAVLGPSGKQPRRANAAKPLISFSLSHSLPFSVSYFLCLSQEYCIKLKSRFDRQLNLPTWLSIWRLCQKAAKRMSKLRREIKLNKVNENWMKIHVRGKGNMIRLSWDFRSVLDKFHENFTWISSEAIYISANWTLCHLVNTRQHRIISYVCHSIPFAKRNTLTIHPLHFWRGPPQVL